MDHRRMNSEKRWLYYKLCTISLDQEYRSSLRYQDVDYDRISPFCSASSILLLLNSTSLGSLPLTLIVTCIGWRTDFSLYSFFCLWYYRALGVLIFWRRVFSIFIDELWHFVLTWPRHLDHLIQWPVSMPRLHRVAGTALVHLGIVHAWTWCINTSKCWYMSTLLSKWKCYLSSDAERYAVLAIQKLTQNQVFVRRRILPTIIKCCFVAITKASAPLAQLTRHIIVRHSSIISRSNTLLVWSFSNDHSLGSYTASLNTSCSMSVSRMCSGRKYRIYHWGLYS